MINHVSFERRRSVNHAVVETNLLLDQDGNVNISDDTEPWLKLSVVNCEIPEFEKKIQERINEAVSAVEYAYRGDSVGHS